MNNTANHYVEIYGEKYRKMIEHALDWLNKKEVQWKVVQPINRDEFIKGLIDKSR